MNRLGLWFVKITGWIPQIFYFRKKVVYVNGKREKIKGKTLIVSNHKALMDYPLYMYIFMSKSLRTLTAEVIYNKGKLMAWFLKKIGCIRVNRDNYDFGFLEETIDILNNNGTALIFPESKLPKDENMQEFKPSFVYIALNSKSPILPVYTNGKYGKRGKAKVVVGEKIYLHELYDNNKSEKENVIYLTNYVRDYILKLGEKTYE